MPDNGKYPRPALPVGSWHDRVAVPARQVQAVRRDIACMHRLCIHRGCGLSGVSDDGAGPRPLLLDLFSGAGGAAVGYHRAGFDVVGVDIEPQPDYPFRFYRHDALQFLAEHARLFDAVHASPPCQHYCRTNRGNSGNHLAYPDLVADIRRALERTALPYVIENVPGAPLHDPVTLCGEMFGLRVIRHRLFESNLPLLQPEHPRHRGWRRSKPARVPITVAASAEPTTPTLNTSPPWWISRAPLDNTDLDRVSVVVGRIDQVPLGTVVNPFCVNHGESLVVAMTSAIGT